MTRWCVTTVCAEPPCPNDECVCGVYLRGHTARGNIRREEQPCETKLSR